MGHVSLSLRYNTAISSLPKVTQNVLTKKKMKLYRLEAEVAGGWGDNTVVDNRAELESGLEIIPRISQLDYALTDWLGDDLIASAPCYLVTESLADAFVSAGMTGFTFADVTITQSPEFTLRSHKQLPHFRWLQMSGAVEMDLSGGLVSWSGDDICFAVTQGWKKPSHPMLALSMSTPYFLAVTENCLTVMKQFSLRHCHKKHIAKIAQLISQDSLTVYADEGILINPCLSNLSYYASARCWL